MLIALHYVIPKGFRLGRNLTIEGTGPGTIFSTHELTFLVLRF